MLDYLRLAQGFEAREQFRILFLDKKNHLIAERFRFGSGDHTPVYVREVVKRAQELSATAIILVHNHSSGDPSRRGRHRHDEIRSPRRAARRATRRVGRHGHASLKAMRLI